jgi:hypothetical protein
MTITGAEDGFACHVARLLCGYDAIARDAQRNRS